MRDKRILAIAILLLCLRCDSEDPQHGFSIVAQEQFVGATVLLDGRQLGQMQHLDTHGGPLEALMKRIYGETPALNVVVVNVDLSERGLPSGRHTLRVEKAGVPAAEGAFMYPFDTDDEWQVFFVNGQTITTSGTS